MKNVDMVVSPQTDCAGGGVVCEVTPIGPASPPTHLRMARGVVCEVTPTGLLMIGDKLLDIRRTSGGDASAGCNAL